MRRIFAALAGVAVLCSGSLIPSVHAAPPTATPSPGYDARLQEQRAPQSTPAYEPVAPVAKPASPRRGKRTRPH